MSTESPPIFSPVIADFSLIFGCFEEGKTAKSNFFRWPLGKAFL